MTGLLYLIYKSGIILEEKSAIFQIEEGRSALDGRGDTVLCMNQLNLSARLSSHSQISSHYS
jgi:hypothetical protein